MRQHRQLEHISALFGGLVVAVDYEKGQKLLDERDFSIHEAFFQDIFEIGRRHKIMNPGNDYIYMYASCNSSSFMCTVTMRTSWTTHLNSTKFHHLECLLMLNERMILLIVSL